MKKKYFRAVATLKDENHEWDVVIYSMYKTHDEAKEGISRFCSHGYNVIRTRIEPA